MVALGAQALGAFGGRQAQAHDIGRVLGAGAHAALLMAADVGWVQRLALAVPHEECPDALGGVDLVAGNGQRVHAGPLLQVDGDAQPGLHRVYMEVGAAVFSFDALGQGSNVLTCAGLVVDSHAGGQDGVFIHGSKEFFSVDMTVPLRGDFDDGEAFLF